MVHKRYTSNYQGEGKRAKPKRVKKQFNKNGIRIIGERPSPPKFINGEVFY
ncbi:hypothetical protein EYB33_14650 [Lysinibacillus sphaericus]|uniref:hypothetical protein n=1 Tax=Lysinibacillus sphaericus TaxID=1421 RepID=UPI001E46DDDD|nr:hypothetical protein [Lysinibacillus sphaericus]UDK97470.1 hypothetical protein EYB33_14650 [Lysinibacillus sphaericus]